MDSPLKDADLRNINRALYELNELIDQLDKAERAGIDCTECRLRRDDLVAKLSAVKNEYFPGR